MYHILWTTTTRNLYDIDILCKINILLLCSPPRHIGYVYHIFISFFLFSTFNNTPIYYTILFICIRACRAVRTDAHARPGYFYCVCKMYVIKKIPTANIYISISGRSSFMYSMEGGFFTYYLLLLLLQLLLLLLCRQCMQVWPTSNKYMYSAWQALVICKQYPYIMEKKLIIINFFLLIFDLLSLM